ncbi:MAG: adenylate/guanylate cyclase domain-containing protein [Dehalococcoidia bacterium]
MPLIDFGDGLVIDVPQGMSVLDASIQHGLQHMHACGGQARCTTCRVEVLAGQENCPPRAEAEAQVLKISRFGEDVRLACQLVPHGDVTVRRLLAQKGAELRPEGLAREREVAILFSDIRGFTNFAQQRLAFDVLHLLNRYFDRMGTVVELNHGQVIAFLGDGMACLFEDLDRRHAAEHAVNCALQMLATAEAFDAFSQEQFEFPLRIGIGIAWGHAVIGQVGYYNKSSLNVIGDVVNTASRVQDAVKETGTRFLVTDDVKTLLDDSFAFGGQFGVELKGKDGVHQLHEVLGKASP